MWTEQQERALHEIQQWLRAPLRRQVFRLFGFAGVGKTSVAKEVANMVGGKAIYGAFTGKAALVLQSRGCAGASTIHSMIYKMDEDGVDPETGDPVFVINHDSDVRKSKVVVIDECSMVDAKLGTDLLSFGVPVLVLGDPAQLPPVKGEGFFTAHEPDVLLTEIHRQAQDNPIIQLSMTVREGKWLKHGQYGNSKVVTRGEIDSRMILEADQVLVGLNRTRHRYNSRIRELRGFHGSPMPGERMIGLKNSRERGILNGSLWDVTKPLPPEEKDDPDTPPVRLRLHPVDANSPRADDLDVKIHPLCFEDRLKEIPWYERRKFDEFTYGYAITVHKAQGSQWEDVVIFDESAAFQEHRKRWLYTGITRAMERVTVVR